MADNNKKRPVRPSALRAAQTFATAGGAEQSASEDEGDGRRPQRRNTVSTRVDLGKLEISSLLRYRKVYKLGEAPANATKEDLVVAVTRHFLAQLLSDEDDILIRFAQAIQRHSGKQQRNPPPASQAPYPGGGGGGAPVVRKVAKGPGVVLPPTKTRR